MGTDRNRRLRGVNGLLGKLEQFANPWRGIGADRGEDHVGRLEEGKPFGLGVWREGRRSLDAEPIAQGDGVDVGASVDDADMLAGEVVEDGLAVGIGLAEDGGSPGVCSGVCDLLLVCILQTAARQSTGILHTLHIMRGERMVAPMTETRQDQRLQLVASREWVAKVDEWRRQQPDLPNRSDAIRRLVDLAIARQGEPS